VRTRHWIRSSHILRFLRNLCTLHSLPTGMYPKWQP
jgi:hypothetical protein